MCISDMCPTDVTPCVVWLAKDEFQRSQQQASPFITAANDPAFGSKIAKAAVVVSHIHNFQKQQDFPADGNSKAKWTHEHVNLTSTSFATLIVDEAHHAGASTWKLVMDYFSKANFICLTATPFHEDPSFSKIPIIYTTPLRYAIEQRYCKNLVLHIYEPSEAVSMVSADDYLAVLQGVKQLELCDPLQFENDDHFQKLSTKSWFREAVADSQECWEPILEAMLEKLHQKCTTGGRLKHKCIIQAPGIPYCEDISDMVNDLSRRLGYPYTSTITHGKLREEDQKANQANFENIDSTCGARACVCVCVI